MLTTRTARELVVEAMRDSGFTGDIEDPSSEESKACLLRLNKIIDSLNIQKLWPVAQKEITDTLVSGQKVYSIGEDGTPDIDTTRPIEIKAIKIQIGDVWYVLEKYSNQDWNNSNITNVSTGYPSSFRYNPTYPNGSIEFNTLPSDSYPMQLVLNQETSSYEFDDEMQLPVGYYDYLSKALTSSWYFKRKRMTNPDMKREADVALQWIKINNDTGADMQTGNGRMWYDYKSGINRVSGGAL